jgi:hypothetical protein
MSILLPQGISSGRFTPNATPSMAVWWPKLSGAVASQHRKELNLLVIVTQEKFGWSAILLEEHVCCSKEVMLE